ncbi:hypothetical protein BH18ACT9_BH18ACT9_04140 [soil metagenome]
MPGVDRYGLTPLEGGWSGETFLADAAGERTVVRIYAHRGVARGPRAVEVDAAVLRLVRGLLPVPEVIEVRRPDTEAGTPAVLVTSLLPGERLDLAWDRMSTKTKRATGAELGTLLARLAQMPMLAPGMFVDRTLRVEPWSVAGGVVGYVEQRLSEGALRAWTSTEDSAMLRLADLAQTHLDRWDRSGLVHSDFNAKNLLVDPVSGAVTGVVDWEFAHAGHPASDLGNLLRFEREPGFVNGVLAGFTERVPDAPDNLLVMARAADLVALVDLAGRAGTNPVAIRAHDLLRRMTHAGCLDVAKTPGATDLRAAP